MEVLALSSPLTENKKNTLNKLVSSFSFKVTLCFHVSTVFRYSICSLLNICAYYLRPPSKLLPRSLKQLLVPLGIFTLFTCSPKPLGDPSSFRPQTAFVTIAGLILTSVISRTCVYFVFIGIQPGCLLTVTSTYLIFRSHNPVFQKCHPTDEPKIIKISTFPLPLHLPMFLQLIFFVKVNTQKRRLEQFIR